MLCDLLETSRHCLKNQNVVKNSVHLQNIAMHYYISKLKHRKNNITENRFSDKHALQKFDKHCITIVNLNHKERLLKDYKFFYDQLKHSHETKTAVAFFAYIYICFIYLLLKSFQRFVV